METTNSSVRPPSSVRQPRALRKDVSKFWDRVRHFERENIEAAEIILRNIGRDGGEGAGVVLWARLVLSRDAERRRAA